jgi:hypothetical protein
VTFSLWKGIKYYCKPYYRCVLKPAYMLFFTLLMTESWVSLKKGKPEIYQIPSSIIQKSSQQSPRYHYKMLRESEECLAKIFGCDD